MMGSRTIAWIQVFACVSLLISLPVLAKDGRSGLSDWLSSLEDNGAGNDTSGSGNAGGNGNGGNGGNDGNDNSGNGGSKGGEDNPHSDDKWWGWMATAAMPGVNVSGYAGFDDYLKHLPAARSDDTTLKPVPIVIEFDVNNCTAITNATTDMKSLARMLVATFGLSSDDNATDTQRLEVTKVDSADCDNSHVTIHAKYLAPKLDNPADTLEGLLGSSSAIIPLSIQATYGFHVTSGISITPTWEGSNWLADLGVTDDRHGDDDGAAYLKASIPNVSTDDVTSVVPIHIQFVTPDCDRVNALATNSTAAFSAAVRFMVAKRAKVDVSRVRYNQGSCVGSLAIIDLDWLVTNDTSMNQISITTDRLVSGFGCMRARFLSTQRVRIVPHSLSTTCDGVTNKTTPTKRAPRKAYTVPLTMTINASAALQTDDNLKALFEDQFLSQSVADLFDVTDDKVNLKVEYEKPGRRRSLLQTGTTAQVSGTVDGVTTPNDTLQAIVAAMSTTVVTSLSPDLVQAFGITGLSASATVKAASPTTYTSDIPFTMQITTSQAAADLASNSTFKAALTHAIASFFGVADSSVALSLNAAAAVTRRSLLTSTNTVSATGTVTGVTTDSTTLQSQVSAFNTDTMSVLGDLTSTYGVLGATASANVVVGQTSPAPLAGTRSAASLLVSTLAAVCALLAMIL